MFANSIIAKGFPVPERRGEMGLEIPFEAMVTLNKILFPLEIPDGIVLKGNSTLLLPLAGDSESVQWHLLCNAQPTENIGLNAIPEHCRSQLLHLDLHTLSQARTFVGYCRDALVIVGTRDSGYGDLDESGIDIDSSTIRIDREMATSIGTSGCGFFGTQITGKIKYAKGLYAPIISEKVRIEDDLLNAKDRPLLLYLADKKLAALVPELSVILTIAHKWAARQHDSEALLAKIPFAQASWNGGKAAYDAIIAARELQLRAPSACEEALYLMALLKDFFLALEQRREMVQQRNRLSVSLQRVPGLQRIGLYGWDLFDIAAFKSSDERWTLINAVSGGQWYKVAERNPKMTVLFCKGLKQPIRPARPQLICQAMMLVPEQKFHLVAMCSCVSELSKCDPTKPQLASNLYLDTSTREEVFEDCDFSGESGCQRVNELVKKPPDRPFPLEARGALIFGIADRSPKWTCRRYKFSEANGLQTNTAEATYLATTSLGIGFTLKDQTKTELSDERTAISESHDKIAHLDGEALRIHKSVKPRVTIARIEAEGDYAFRGAQQIYLQSSSRSERSYPTPENSSLGLSTETSIVSYDMDTFKNFANAVKGDPEEVTYTFSRSAPSLRRQRGVPDLRA